MHLWWRWVGIAIFLSVIWGLLCFAEPCVLHDKLGRPLADPCGAAKHPVITYTIPAALLPRADAEVRLIRMLHQDLAETQAGMLNAELRRKMVTLMLKIQKEDQQRP